MNCSTGLYQTPFNMAPVLMALKRAVTTASCKKNHKLSSSMRSGMCTFGLTYSEYES